MKAENLATNARNTRPSRFREVPEERGKNVPTLEEIHRRALEIHIERSGHGYDLDKYLEERQQAERELRESTAGVTIKAQKRNEMGLRKERR
jgi:hypothetical protein